MKDSLTDRLLRRELETSGRLGKIRKIYGDRNWIQNLDIVNELDGHSGCVNALSWSKSGRLLASGSDDQHLNIHTYQPEDSTSQFALTTTIATGHTANIFSVKFMPHSNDRTLITAAGDHEVRIFDIEYSGGATESSAAATIAANSRRGRRNTIYDGVKYLSDGDTNCRVYRSHGDRVKRIVTESSPHLFLTCSEDGEVRQWDLRQPSSAYPSPRTGRLGGADGNAVPPPLISYKRYNLDLNTISCSPSQPHYIALGGAHLHCFLHDRRMLGRDRIHERGGTSLPAVAASETDEELMNQATQCVRKFAPMGQSKMRRTDNGHITACKISDANPNEMVVSWSGEHIYSFDLIRSPDASEAQQAVRSPMQSSSSRKVRESSERKRKRKTPSQVSLSNEGAERSGSRQRTEVSSTREDNDGEVALRVKYQNGQSEDIPIDSVQPTSAPASGLRDTVLNDRQQNAYRIANSVVRLRKSMFSLGTQKPRITTDPLGYASSFTTVMSYTASVLPDMNRINQSWRYPIEPSEEGVAIQRILRSNRDSAYRFVQAAGVIARVLGGRVHTASADNPRESAFFSRIAFTPNEGPDLPRHEQFGYDFIKAITLWLDSGVGALLEGFTSSSHLARNASRMPVPETSGIEAVDEVVIPYLLRLASDRPVMNVDSSRFEVDETRRLYVTEKEAVLAFAAALKIPFADLSSAIVLSNGPSVVSSTQPPTEPMQSRSSALAHWGLRVARGVLMNAGEAINFALVDRAFGGLGTPDDRIREEEASFDERHENIESDEGEDVVQAIEIVDGRRGAIAAEAADGTGASEYSSPDRNEEDSEGEQDFPIPMGDFRVILEENTGEDSDNDEVAVGDVDVDARLGVRSEDDDDDEDDEEEAEPGFPRFVYRSAFERRRLRERVEARVPCSAHTRVYRGHCNVKTVKDVNFFGLQDEYVVSGSDDGNLFIWDRKTGQLVNILEGDGEVVNVLQGHPYETMLAVSGIDHTIKIFSPDSRARETARLGRGVEAADASNFSSISWPRRTRGRLAPTGNLTTSEPAMPAGSEEQRVDDDEQYVAPNGLPSRKRMGDEYRIVAQNDVDRQGGNQEAFITRSMLATLAQHIRRRREEGGDDGEDDEGEDLGGLGGRIVIGDDCTVM
ncbi:hypothetical protein MBLNU459_g3525t1 [Dothideomycetes sp. NU459]